MGGRCVLRGMVIAVFVLAAGGVSSVQADELEDKMKMFEMLDQLDAEEFELAADAAANCIVRRQFNCAYQKIEEAGQYIVNDEHQWRLNELTRDANAEYQLAQQDEARQRQMLAEQRRLEREQEEFEAQMQRERRRMEREAEAEANHDPYNTGIDWRAIAGAANAYTDALREQSERQAQQYEAQRRMQEQQREMERNQAARQQAYNQQQQELENRRRELQRQQAARQRELENRRQEAQRQQQQAARQRAAQQAAQLAAAATASSASSSQSSGQSSGSDLQYTGRSYEPNPIVVTKRNQSPFSTREMAVNYARLAAVNEITAQCRQRGARSDGPTYRQISNGEKPPAWWNFSAPDCKQGGWDDKEWICSAQVAGTCYRN